VYLIRSRGQDTLAFMAAHRSGDGYAGHVLARLRLLAVSLLYDDEHRLGVWDGPRSLPAWQVGFVCALVAVAVVSGLVDRSDGIGRWRRATSAAFVVLAAVMVWTRLPVRGHHLLTLVPFAVVALVLGVVRLVERRPTARPLLAVVAALYLGIALYWDVSAVRGLIRTGGTGQWSDGTLALARYLDARRAPRVTAFDWGYHNSLYVVTAGRVAVRELFWYTPGAPGAPVWSEEIVPGGIYLTHAPLYQYDIGKPATAEFRQALARSGLPYTTVVFRDRRGRAHTELVEVGPPS
jgi:hypothetical protein